jgi:hypothetical protein
VTTEVYGEVPGKDRGLDGQYRNKEQALIARMSSTTYGYCLGGERAKEVERERTHFSFRRGFRLALEHAEKYSENHLPGKTMNICTENRVLQVPTSVARRLLLPISQRTCGRCNNHASSFSFTAGSLPGLNSP